MFKNRFYLSVLVGFPTWSTWLIRSSRVVTTTVGGWREHDLAGFLVGGARLDLAGGALEWEGEREMKCNVNKAAKATLTNDGANEFWRFALHSS